jgi:acetyl esterase/lipase
MFAMVQRVFLAAALASASLQTAPALVPPGPDTNVAVEENVVYGMYSGLALLLDVYSPSVPNGRGVVLIQGSGWHSNRGYHAGQKKANAWELATELADAGFRVFAINHREAPRFRWPAARDDVQRAVRWVRHHADRYDIDPDAIGVMGSSSGGHLAALLGTIEGSGNPESPDPVERESSRVQAVALFAPATDLDAFGYEPRVVAMMGHTVVAGDGLEAYMEASPINHVSSDDPPFFIVHGQNDQVVPVEQSIEMARALEHAGVEVELTVLPDGNHNDVGRPEKAVHWLAEKLAGPEWAEGLASLEKARRILDLAQSSAAEGDIDEALRGYERAQALDSRLTIQVRSWDVLCRSGALHGMPARVIDACDRAVALRPGSGRVHDSRGLARALTGNLRGAIADFEALVSSEAFGIQGYPAVSSATRQERAEWIEALRSGRNPFTPEVLDALRNRGD